MVEILTPEQILENFQKFTKFIENSFRGERQEKLLKLVSDYEDRIALAPASDNVGYHNAFPGGYVEHVMRVIEMAVNYYSYLKDTVGVEFLNNVTLEEVMFAALNHDLGKIGVGDEPYYEVNTSDWHVRNQGKIYKKNNNLVHMSVPDRSVFLLNSYGISFSENEYLAIKIHDGLYDEANTGYFKQWNIDQKQAINLAVILHHADHVATMQEKAIYRKLLEEQIGYDK